MEWEIKNSIGEVAVRKRWFIHDKLRYDTWNYDAT